MATGDRVQVHKREGYVQWRLLETTTIKVPQNKREESFAIILIRRTEQYCGKTNLYKLSCIQFKRHLSKHIGQKINLYIFNREGIFT